MSAPSSSAAAQSTTVATARKEFFRDQVRESFNDGAPGVVGEINRAFSAMSHACIERLPSDRYAVHGDRHMVLALTDVFLHVLCSFFVFEHSFDDQLLSDGHVLLQLCRWSDADKAVIKRRMHHVRVLPLGYADRSSARVAHCVRYEHDLSLPTLRSLCLDALARSNTPATVLPPQLRDDLVKLRQLQAEVDAARIFGRAVGSSPSSIVRYGAAVLEEHSWHAMQRASGMPGPWTGVQHTRRASRR